MRGRRRRRRQKIKRQGENRKSCGKKNGLKDKIKRKTGISVEQYRKYPSSRLAIIDLTDGTRAVAGVKSDGSVLMEQQISNMGFLQKEKRIRDLVFHRGGVAVLREDGTVRGTLLNNAGCDTGGAAGRTVEKCDRC